MKTPFAFDGVVLCLPFDVISECPFLYIPTGSLLLPLTYFCGVCTVAIPTLGLLLLFPYFCPLADPLRAHLWYFCDVSHSPLLFIEAAEFRPLIELVPLPISDSCLLKEPSYALSLPCKYLAMFSRFYLLLSAVDADLSSLFEFDLGYDCIRGGSSEL